MPILTRKILLFGCHKKTRWSQGFTQIELIVVIGVLAVLTLIGMRVYSHFIDKAKNTRAIAELRVLEKEILEFWHTNDRLPDNLGELDRAAMLDPWKTPYQYINFDTAPDSEEKRRTKGNKGKGKGKGDPLNVDYDLFSKGKDRTCASVLTDDTSKDDIIRADDGSYTGLASGYKS
jgi:general secretion pathway protein G